MPFDAGNCGKQHSRFKEVAICKDLKILPTNINVFPVKVLIICSNINSNL